MAAKAGSSRTLSKAEIVEKFQSMRQEQNAIASKISELELEKKEHRLVIETLKDCDGDRKCFRMIGGVLVERTVAEVRPALESNEGNINSICDMLHKQLAEKGKELNDFKASNNLRLQGETEQQSQKKEDAKSTGVLVS